MLTETMADTGAERYALGLILLNDGADLLDTLEAQDFHDSEFRFVFAELQQMRRAGYPIEPDALARWFTSSATRGRAERIHLKDLGALVASIGGEYVTSAHREFYVGILHRERLRRGLAMISVKLAEKNEANTDQPAETIEWLEGRFQSLWDFAYKHFPELKVDA
jgi:replicative DNA helicase